MNDRMRAEMAVAPESALVGRRCEDCGVWTFNADHVCVRYDGPACQVCGAGTVFYTLGAPGYGAGERCANGHDTAIGPRGILTLEDVR